MNKPCVLLIESNGPKILELRDCLWRRGFTVLTASNLQEGMEALPKHDPDLVVISSPQDHSWDGIEMVKAIRRKQNTLPIILITLRSSEARVLAALRAGVNDYFSPPLSKEKILASVLRKLPPTFRQEGKARQVGPDLGPISSMVGESHVAHEIKKSLLRFAESDSTVLITGETGTGKELAAEIIHQISRRYSHPMVCINCTALPESLVESELFGYETGAFTGAAAPMAGKLEMGEGGSVFLDEIGDMNPLAQAKILRAIEKKEVFRLGGKRPMVLDVRFIAATNQNLEDLVAQGKFRKDLYYRLNIARLHIPPLRQRKEDIPCLVSHCLTELNGKFCRKVQGLTEEAFDFLLRHDWPGNVRELKNLIEATLINLSSDCIGLADLPGYFLAQIGATKAIRFNERDRVISALQSTNWNKSEAARKLRWSRMTLYRRLAEFKINKDQFSAQTASCSEAGLSQESIECYTENDS